MRKFNNKKFKSIWFCIFKEVPRSEIPYKKSPPRNFIYGPSRRCVSEEFGEMKFCSSTRFLETFERIRTKRFVKLITIIDNNRKFQGWSKRISRLFKILLYFIKKRSSKRFFFFLYYKFLAGSRK